MSEDPFKKYQEAKVPQFVKEKVYESSISLIKPKLVSVVFKYILLFCTSIIFSLMICPQRGVGILSDSYPFFHKLLHQSEILCGLYCGFMFFITTHVLSFSLLNHFERLVIVRKVSYLPVLMMTLFFGLSMTSFFSNLELSSYYFSSWILLVMAFYLALTFYYNKAYIIKKEAL